jgi:hypothetical protein
MQKYSHFILIWKELAGKATSFLKMCHLLACTRGILFLLLFSSCVKNTLPPTLSLKSDLEVLSLDHKYFVANNDTSYFFKGGSYQTGLRHRSGQYAVLSTPENAFVLAIQFQNVYRDSYVEAEIWKQGSDAHLVCVPSGLDEYYTTDQIVETDSSGWQKFKLSFYVPPIYEFNELKFYVWNSGQDTVFYDDIKLTITKNKSFPTYLLPSFHIEIDTVEMTNLLETRIKAFEAGILQSEDDDWVKGFIFTDGHDMKAKLRLKGDWLDHLHGPKWSYRVKLKKDYSWNRMKVFSVQNPTARLGVNEWFLHQVMMSEGLLTTRYGFMPLTLNGRNMGLYAWEEHFVKQLVESQNRREGPILRFLENALWDTRVKDENGKMNDKLTPVFDVAAIKPFPTGKIVEDSGMFTQYNIAQNLMYQYKKRLRRASEIFNVEMLAKYFAMSDVFLARHSIIWHNQRFYYNPVLCKLEPIAYDCYSDIGLEEELKNPITGFLQSDMIQPEEFIMVRELFNDSVFMKSYIHYLKKYSDVRYLDSVFNDHRKEVNFYDSLVRREYPEQVFFEPNILANAEIIRNTLPAFQQQFDKMKKDKANWVNQVSKRDNYDSVLPAFFAPNLILAYKEQVIGDSCVLKVQSYFPDQLTILGIGRKSKKIREIVVPAPKLSASRHGVPVETEFTISNEEANFLFFTMAKSDEIFSTEINHWPEPDGEPSPLQQLIDRYPFPDTTFVKEIVDRNIYVKGGHIVIGHPVMIPSGYRVVFQPGTTIDLIHKAMIITHSPVSMLGREDAPILIASSDSTSNGFVVLQADEKSLVSNTRFESLNTLNYKGWTLTGAVTFYESDVDMVKTQIVHNHCEDALNIVRSNFVVDQCRFEGIFGDAFDSDFSQGQVLHTDFIQIGNDAIDFSGSQILISQVNISGADDKGVSGGENSQLTLEDVTITNCNIGIASKDLSMVEVFNSSVSHCKYGLVLLQKKPEYGPASMMLKNTKISDSEQKMLIELGSSVIIDGKLIPGDASEVAKLFY